MNDVIETLKEELSMALKASNMGVSVDIDLVVKAIDSLIALRIEEAINKHILLDG